MAQLSVTRKIYRTLNWVTLAGLIVVVILLLHKSPPPGVSYDPGAAKRVEEKFEAANQARAAGQPAQVAIDRTELNSYLAQNLQLKGSTGAASSPRSAESGPPVPSDVQADPRNPVAALAGSDPQTVEQMQSSVKDVKVDMDGDLVKAYVIFDFHGSDLSLELEGRLAAQDGYLKFEPVAGKLGSLPLPESTLKSAVSKMMSSPENREKLKLPDDISDIRVADGQAVLSYK